MNSQEIYKKETGLDAIMVLNSLHIPTPEYIEWLEKTVESTYKPQLVSWIENMFEHAKKKQWFETYHFYDLHGVISKPDYRKKSKKIDYYPYAKETLQILTQRKDIILVLFTSSYPYEIETYVKQFSESNIIFNYVNENPEITEAKGNFGYYEKKPYYNFFADDKCGFNPYRDWKFLFEYYSTTQYRPDEKWSRKYKEDYHK